MIKIIRSPSPENEVKEFLGKPFSEMIKFVVDIQQEILALGGELHADGESVLLEQGSQQADLWGGNYYPARPGEKRIEYTSLINIRPSAGNSSWLISDETLK